MEKTTISCIQCGTVADRYNWRGFIYCLNCGQIYASNDPNNAVQERIKYLNRCLEASHE